MYNVDLNEVATRFCGAILFDGEGNSIVVTANECFKFTTLRSEDAEDEPLYFNHLKDVDVSLFNFDDLPSNVKDVDEIKANFLKELESLSKSKRKELIEDLKKLS